MTEEQPALLKAADIAAMEAFAFQHPLNPQSDIQLRSLGRAVGLRRLGVTLARVPAGKESFIYHAHQNEEEWIYILSGRGMAEIGDKEYVVEPGDFMGFGLPQQPHHLRNPFEDELVYLIGGEAGRLDVARFPRLGKRVIRDDTAAHILDDAALQLFWSSAPSQPA